jgi:hypothetical protein
MKRVVVAALALGVLGAAQTASAHPLDLGYLRLQESGATVAVSLDVDLRTASVLLGREPLEATDVAASADALASASYASAPITTDAGPCRWGTATAIIRARTVTIASTATCAGRGARRWSFPFVSEERVSSTFELMVKETVGDSERLTTVSRGRASIVLADTNHPPGVSFTDFVTSGIEHIGVAPGQWRDTDGGLRLPDGIDHILFLFGLMLGGGTLVRLLGIASGFTLGHSITLAIAVLGIARPPASVIEPLIALSIALVAVEAFTGRFERHRWSIATFFGLIHGFGFANALTRLDLSTGDLVKALFGYNLGVELGQVSVVLVVAPLVLLAHRTVRHSQYLVRAMASGVFVCGMFWFVERVSG